MADSFTTYTPNNTGVENNQVISSSNEKADRSAVQASISNLNTFGQDTSHFKYSFQTVSYVRDFDLTKVSTGTNTIAISASATTFYDKTTDTEQTSWSALTSTDVSSYTEGKIWAIYPGKTYTITDNLPSNRPANSYRVATFTNSGGTVTVTADWQNPIESKDLIIEEDLTVNGSFFVGSDSGLYALPKNYQDIRSEYKNASTITIKSGSRVRSSDDTTDIILSGDLDIDLTVSGAGGIDTGSEATDTVYYAYLIYNPTTATASGVFSTTDEEDSGTITLPSGYTKKAQILINNEPYLVYNDTSGDIYYTGGSTVYLTGGSGYGSTDTKIRRFSDLIHDFTTSITYADTATNGAVFTIERDGLYHIAYCDGRTTSASNSNIGISVNSSSLTTNIESISSPERLGYLNFNSYSKEFSVTYFLKKGDVIRGHTNGQPNETGVMTWFRITKVG